MGAAVSTIDVTDDRLAILARFEGFAFLSNGTVAAFWKRAC
jgi:hypothetical protein